MSGAVPRVIVGLSGGVDSAVAALCLIRDGYQVEGLHMTNWDAADEYCTAGEDLADARRAAADLGIPLHHVNFSREYREEVFADFLRELRAGRTPNPDVACNRHIKFGVFLHHATRLGADFIATGHYARVMRDGRPGLWRPADRDKDQTYFLHAIDGSALRKSLFPLGTLQKAEVRRLALDYGLANHARPDSTGICFIGERPFRQFLAEHVPAEPGPILTDEGAEVGTHMGLAFYTLGQREGLGVGGRRGALAAPWFVAAKDIRRNTLIVVQGDDHPLLRQQEISAGDLRWLTTAPGDLADGIDLHARIRHRHEPAACRVRQVATGGLHIRFEQPQRSPTPGQSVVFYRGDECLGGGVIEEGQPGLHPSAITGHVTA